MTKFPSSLGSTTLDGLDGLGTSVGTAGAGLDLSIGGQLEPVSAGLGSIHALDLSSIGAVSPGLSPGLTAGLAGLGDLAASVGTAGAGLDLSIGAVSAGLDVHANRKLLDFPGRLPSGRPRGPRRQHRHPTHRPDDIDAFLERTLGMLNPAFPCQFRGSLQRSEERGPDWWTQAAASERKLFLGVLHAAAPNDLVMPWVTSPKHQLDEHDRPTRRTRIAWLCRSIPNKSYRKFLLTELDSALALIELFNTAVHVDEFPEFEQSFSWTQLRLKVAMRHILEIWLKWS